MAMGLLPRKRIMGNTISAKQISNVRNQRIVRVWIRQEGADRKKNLCNGQSRRPLVLQNVKADAARPTNVTVVDLGYKLYLGRRKGVVYRELDVEAKYTSLIGCCIWTNNGGLPTKEIRFVYRASGAIEHRLLVNLLKLLGYPLESHL